MTVAAGEENGTTAATMTAGVTGTTGGEQYNVENHCDDEGGRRQKVSPCLCVCCWFICKRERANYEVEIHHDLSKECGTCLGSLFFLPPFASGWACWPLSRPRSVLSSHDMSYKS